MSVRRGVVVRAQGRTMHRTAKAAAVNYLAARWCQLCPVSPAP
jgi:hypothetical protein